MLWQGILLSVSVGIKSCQLWNKQCDKQAGINNLFMVT